MLYSSPWSGESADPKNLNISVLHFFFAHETIISESILYYKHKGYKLLWTKWNTFLNTWSYNLRTRRDNWSSDSFSIRAETIQHLWTYLFIIYPTSVNSGILCTLFLIILGQKKLLFIFTCIFISLFSSSKDGGIRQQKNVGRQAWGDSGQVK